MAGGDTAMLRRFDDPDTVALVDRQTREMLAIRGGAEEIAQGLALTAYFLERNIFHPQVRPLPDARLRLATRFPAGPSA